MNPSRLRTRTPERGAALLLVVVIIAVLVVVGYALLGRSTSENEAIGAKRHYDHTIACVDAAREYLLSQFRTYSVSPTSITPVSATAGDVTMRTGHYDQFNITTVTAENGFQQTSLGTSDISNRTVKTGLGGQVYRMTVACSTAGNAQQNEVEFVVRFGL